MSTWSLFSTRSDEAGYRLEYMDIYNWGTFDGRVFTISPEGNNSLLTGPNGSGKTTFVDALLTLMVPRKHDRFYNQSSGIQKKGDRTEETYVLGNYGDMQEEGKLNTTVQQLRDKRTNPYSIILACFSNNEGRQITLFQARWFYNGSLKREFGIAQKPLKISRDFSPFDRNWKRKLDLEHNADVRKKIVEFIEGPTRYAEKIVRIFGMRSPKALSLFNQTAGIKVLGNLDEFIRNNMLEHQDAEQEFGKLKESFETLNDAQNNIEKATRQIEWLKPIDELARKIASLKETVAEYESYRQISVLWFAEKGTDLLSGQIRIKEKEKQIKLEKLQSAKEYEEKLRDDAARLNAAIETNETTRKISELDREIRELTAQKAERRNKYGTYNEMAQTAGLKQNPDEEAFYRNSEEAQKKQLELDNKLENLDRDIDLEKERDRIDDDIRQTENEIRSLLNRNNNIPHSISQIRDGILKTVGASKPEIPFVGEIMRVRKEESAWESAIERLLHNVALRLIVPEMYYKPLNQYVNRTNLNGRIVYQRYRKTGRHRVTPADSNVVTVVDKLEFNGKSEYAVWVENLIKARFDYICTDDLEAFASFDKAVTSNGLIKSGGGRHEKDDRPHVLRKDRHVLGWDNTEKVRWLRNNITRLREDLKLHQEKISLKQETRKKLREQSTLYRDFQRDYPGFDSINWQPLARQIEEKEKARRDLENSDDKGKELKKQLTDVNSKIEGLENQKNQLNKDIGKIEQTLENYEDRRRSYEETLRSCGDLPDRNQWYDKFTGTFSELKDITFQQLESLKDKTGRMISEKLEACREQAGKYESRLQLKMQAFKHPGDRIPESYQQSWRADVNKLSDNTEYVKDYQDMLVNLENDGLDKYRKEFEKYLTETLTNKIGSYKQFFDDWRESIRENIRSLNDSLRNINFKSTPETYVQLKTKALNVSPEIREFNGLLQQAIPNFAEWNSNLDKKREHFESHIITLIKRLSEDSDWRLKVTDVRNWFKYYAEEFYRDSDQSMKVYEEMGKLSGGEKAQLTYTILGSAISYQFGLTRQGLENRSFRFIVVDESFSNQDDERATYLMDLCRQLHLQLLVVTPSDKIHIVEPFISYVHLVERIDNKTSWIRDMPIRQFQEERKKQMAEANGAL